MEKGYENIQLKVCAETVKKFVRLLLNIFFMLLNICVAASGNISCFFKERAAASESKCATASEQMF